MNKEKTVEATEKSNSQLTNSKSANPESVNPQIRNPQIRNPQIQLRGAAISIMNNIAEGFDSSSNKEFVRFLFFSSRSCSEIISMSYILKDIYNLKAISDELQTKTLSCRKQIKGFIKYLNSK